MKRKPFWQTVIGGLLCALQIGILFTVSENSPASYFAVLSLILTVALWYEAEQGIYERWIKDLGDATARMTDRELSEGYDVVCHRKGEFFKAAHSAISAEISQRMQAK